MVNNYNLELELLRKSKVTDRAPKSIIDDSDYTVYSTAEEPNEKS
jgi:hypothetical protein